MSGGIYSGEKRNLAAEYCIITRLSIQTGNPINRQR